MKLIKKIAITIVLIHLLLTQIFSVQCKKARIKIKNKILNIEIADTNKKKIKGLMYRRHLPWNSGMLFVYTSERILHFWMKNTYIPLDIGFFNKNKILVTVKNMKPLNETSVSSEVPVKYALEVNKGWFKKNNIRKGSKFLYINN